MRFIFRSANASEPHHGPESTFTKDVFEHLKRILLLRPCTPFRRRSQIPPASSSTATRFCDNSTRGKIWNSPSRNSMKLWPCVSNYILRRNLTTSIHKKLSKLGFGSVLKPHLR